MKLATLLLTGATVIVAAVAALGTVLLAFPGVATAEETLTALMVSPEIVKWGYAAAAGSAGLSALGAGYAVAHVGSAAVGALAEKPDLMGRVLVMVGLAEGIAIYGLIISILILNRVA